MPKEIISTNHAPAAIGPYSQAVKVDKTVYLSGQIPLDPKTMEVIEGDISEQTKRAFKNIQAVCEAAGGSLEDIVKLNIYLTDLGDFQAVNTIMESFIQPPFPARAVIGVSELPKKVNVEIEGIMVLIDK